MTDPVADMLIRIKNAYLAGKKTVIIPYSKVKESIANVLVANGYITSFVKKETPTLQGELEVVLTYKGKQPAVTDVKRISKPGRRSYSNVEKIPKTLGGYGVTIISTSQGVMSDKDAKKKNIGGEVLCQIW